MWEGRFPIKAREGRRGRIEGGGGERERERKGGGSKRRGRESGGEGTRRVMGRGGGGFYMANKHIQEPSEHSYHLLPQIPSHKMTSTRRLTGYET